MMRALARALVLTLGLALLASARAEARDPDSHFFHPFLGDLREELAQARASGRKGLMLMYHFEECPSCQRMRREVLNRPEVQDWFRRAFVVLPIDVRGAQPVTGLGGETLPEREYGRAMRIRATPTFDFYGLDGTQLYRHVGGLFTPAEFLLLGRYVVSGAYQGETFKQYRQSAGKGN
ncbi:MAG: thioredoxin family protein [Burkholderiales bacterium]|nr:thioredoxin family protein [Burkholderiales bacterium]